MGINVDVNAGRSVGLGSMYDGGTQIVDKEICVYKCRVATRETCRSLQLIEYDIYSASSLPTVGSLRGCPQRQFQKLQTVVESVLLVHAP